MNKEGKDMSKERKLLIVHSVMSVTFPSIFAKQRNFFLNKVVFKVQNLNLLTIRVPPGTSWRTTGGTRTTGWDLVQT